MPQPLRPGSAQPNSNRPGHPSSEALSNLVDSTLPRLRLQPPDDSGPHSPSSPSSQHSFSQPVPFLTLPTLLPPDLTSAIRAFVDQPAGSLASDTRESPFLSPILSRLYALEHTLEDANSHLRALLELPVPDDTPSQTVSQPVSSLPLPSSQASSMAMATEMGTNNAAGSRRESSYTEDTSRISKRRRLDANKTDRPPFKALRYGRYGQVEPGSLKMEIVSCDGGLYSDGAFYAAENILKNDDSVYCTKGNRCNIVLQHHGSTAFRLKELIIKAPGRNYSSPVRAGMVFLSMSKDELLRTDQYQSCPPAAPHAHAIALNRANALRSYALARITAQRLAAAIPGYRNTASENFDGPRHFEEFVNLVRPVGEPGPLTAPTNPAPLAPPAAPSATPAFYVETECSDGEDGDVAVQGSAAGRARRDRGGGNDNERGAGWRPAVSWSPTPLRDRISRRPPMYEEPSTFGLHANAWDMDHDDEDNATGREVDDDDDDYAELYDPGDLGHSTLSSPESPRNDRNDHDNNVPTRDSHGREADEARTAPATGAPTDIASQWPQAVSPHAEFHIEKHNNKCTIYFNPPVTARYILLKIWNPQPEQGGNIDIQGVMVKGFAGPRYVPAMEFR